MERRQTNKERGGHTRSGRAAYLDDMLEDVLWGGVEILSDRGGVVGGVAVQGGGVAGGGGCQVWRWQKLWQKKPPHLAQ